MNTKTALRRLGIAAWMLAAMATAVSIGFADHSWGNYHWSRTSNPFTVQLGDNVSSAWDTYLTGASTDWSQSLVLDTAIVTGGTDPRRCRATSGRVEVCNASYGNTGWLGVASVWLSGDHIAQATVKMNDFYFAGQPYSSFDWRRSVMCQEIGHTLGLDHQDEDFDNTSLFSCMDYQEPPFPYPNSHDYEQLVTIYNSHLDTPSGGGGGGSKGKGGSGLPSGFTDLEVGGPGQWGRLVASLHNGTEDVYEADFGGGNRVITFVRRVN